MHRSVATAPGKAIIFGEHAVVYGTTAVAASLSELRISVDTVRLHLTNFSSCSNCLHSFYYRFLQRSEPGSTDLVVTFDDIPRVTDNKPSVATISLSSIKSLMSHHAGKLLLPGC